MTSPDTPPTSYDLLVIGGGSGGIACARRASALGAHVGLCDFVAPSPTLGTSWGLGGTCVNVGCIPKKLMHNAARLGGEAHHAACAFGWGNDASPPTPQAHTWEVLRQNVLLHIKSLNFGYNVELRKAGVKYHNALASIRNVKSGAPYEIALRSKTGEASTVWAARVVLAMGGRPTLPAECPGARAYGITSDDLFRLARDPGRCCVVGASYVALECAGFLRGLGKEVVVLIRSIPLRGYDQQMAQKIVEFMETVEGVRFVRQAVPVSVEVVKPEAGNSTPDEIAGPERRKVTWRHADGTTGAEIFDTVLFAIGRTPETTKVGLPLEAVDVKNGKVLVDSVDQVVGVHNVYAIGDIAQGGLELTPVAIRQGQLLADRLFGGRTEALCFEKVPTTVFTPLEYGCVGLSEERATEIYGEDAIEVYHSSFTPLEWTLVHSYPANTCYIKIITTLPLRGTGDHGERVVGFHILSPNAGEITQGVAVALCANATKQHFDTALGIHPTVAEEMIGLHVTKRSGKDPEKSGC